MNAKSSCFRAKAAVGIDRTISTKTKDSEWEVVEGVPQTGVGELRADE